MIAKRVSSLAEVADAVRAGGEFSLVLRDFLDGFQAEPDAEKLAEEPWLISFTLHDGGLADAYLAAVCDHLCRQYWWPRPEWCLDPIRVLYKPHFAAKTHHLRVVLLQESPTAFKQRNIFVSANALSRA